VAALALSVFTLEATVGLRRRHSTPTRRPTLIGHRPGVGTTRLDGTPIYEPYCACGWKGEPTRSERYAREKASDHAKGLL
jgi:hypothetical protein